MTEVAAPAPMPTTPEAGRAMLDGKLADKAWGAKLLARDPDTFAEFQTLSRIASDDSAAIAAAKAAAPLNPSPSNVPPTIEQQAEASELAAHNRQVTDIVAWARGKFEVSPGVEEELRTGRPVSQAEHDAVKQFRSQKMSDPEWAAALLKGDPKAARELFLIAVVLSADIKQEADKP